MNTDKHGFETGVAVRKVALLTSVVGAVLSLNGCTYALHPYNTPSDQTLRVVNPTPEQYSMRVEDLCRDEHKVYPVDTNGIVSFHVPSLPRGCAVYLFGGLKVSDARSENVRAVELQKDGRTVRKLSLNDIAKLATDTNGVRQIKIR
jgi:hypothetical protein